MKKPQLFLAAGQIALAVSILLGRFVKDSAFVSFSIGLLTGLSLVFNLAFLINYRKEKSK
ncbi:hypothetical protein JW906_08860 [bacterium]|nr:hypothetical protein [bacterium]